MRERSNRPGGKVVDVLTAITRLERGQKMASRQQDNSTTFYYFVSETLFFIRFSRQSRLFFFYYRKMRSARDGTEKWWLAGARHSCALINKY